ncbi:IS1595 family transposase [Methylosinus sporium]|uniref:IS1595 family transposase n=1 Tax=Methylosinus sporium TaxID=428 RepID=A0A549T101_METSR|nr:IS1595 family transposase [Methylosinus sporium]TRL35540.1 IS1595 family transposase [Methylosinus sporium]
MESRQFERLKAAIVQADAEQCVELEALVRQVAARRHGEIALVRKTKAVDETRRCPHCGHTDVVKHGFDKAGRFRFRCRKGADEGCGKTFNALTGTPFARMRMPEKWADYARLMERFTSINKIAESGIGISHHTAWRWRHRMLAVQAMLQSDQVSGVVEADEVFFRTSYKGSRGWKQGKPPENRPARYRGGKAVAAGLSGEQVPVLTAVDSAGGVIEAVLRDRSGIVPALEGRIARGSVVCSDGLKQYVKAAVSQGSEHRRIEPPRKDWLAKAVGGKPRRPGRLGLGRVNGHHERLKTLINRHFRGVSTKYLPNYLGWARASRRPGFGALLILEQALAA